MARFWLGPVPWLSDLQGARYQAPALALGWIDLRSLAQCGTPNVVGNGFFVTPNAANLGSSYTNLGTDLERVLTTNQRNLLQSQLGLPQQPVSDILGTIIYDAITRQADPTGQDRCLPLVPTVKRDFEIWLAGVKVRSRPFARDGLEAAPLRDLLQRAYRRIRQACLDGQAPPEHYRKVLGYWVRKYRLAYRWFQPLDLPDESDLAPTTTITDNFDGIDSTTLGKQLTWTEVSGNHWSNTSNQAIITGGGAGIKSARADHDLSGTDHYSQADYITADSANGLVFLGPAARFDSAANTFYAARIFAQTANYEIAKCVAGVVSDLGGDTVETVSTPDTLKTECDGSTISGYFNGVVGPSVTDTAITTGTRCGLCGNSTGGPITTLDNFEAADLAVAPTGNRRRRVLLGAE